MNKPIGFAVAVLVSLLAYPASAAAPVIGKVIQVNGTAWTLDARKRMPLKAGSDLHQGDRLKTDAASQMTIKLGNDVAVLVKENTDAKVEEVLGKDWSLQLIRGAVLSSVKNPDKRPDHFRIKSRAAVMGVRGTVFYVKDDPQHGVHVCTCNGTVAISSPDGKSTEVITSKHHDAPKDIQMGPGPIAGRLQAAELSGHSDPEAVELQKILE